MDNNDAHIVNLILEFIIRQPVDSRQLKSLLHALPPPNADANLKKLLLLKQIEADVSQRSLSETTLDLLEMLEEIEFQQGNEAVSDKMKSAYCAVAVDCTLKHLVDGGDEGKIRFFKTVEWLWRGRIARMKDLEIGGLGSELLWTWKDEIEAAAEQDSARESVLEKFEEVEADEAVRVYLKEEREKMGPSLIEVLVKSVLEREKEMGPAFVELVRRVKRDVAFELMAFLLDMVDTM